jgi:hypothetical protein
VLDCDGRPSFEMLQRHETQVAFYAFDVLQIGGTDTIACRTSSGAQLLASLVEPVPLDGAGAPRGRRRRAARGHCRAGPGGRDGQAARFAVRGGQALAALAQGEEPVRSRWSSAASTRAPGRVRTRSARCSWASRPDGSAALRRRRRHRLHAGAAPSRSPRSCARWRHASARSTRTHLGRRCATPPGCGPSCAPLVEIAEFTNDGHVRHASFIDLAP